MSRTRTRPAERPSPAPIRRRRKEKRPSEILDAAFEEFAVNGFEAARLDDVARRAGIAKGTIYLYFRDKEQLFRAMVRKLIVPTVEDMETSAAAFFGSAEELGRQLIGRQYAQLVDNPKARAVLRMLIAESNKFPQLSEIWYREVFQRARRLTHLVLARGIASGECRRTKVIEFPFMLGAPGMLAVVWQLIFGERHPLDLDAYREAHLDLILNGVKAQKPAKRRRSST
ncbi:MAG: TetR/AcrR family transcriptional regulator [Candidatus Acidiferrales bacterium]|jgi:AcrR family transcriptional regulator